jgi:hypothetical protein
MDRTSLIYVYLGQSAGWCRNQQDAAEILTRQEHICLQAPATGHYSILYTGGVPGTGRFGSRVDALPQRVIPAASPLLTIHDMSFRLDYAVSLFKLTDKFPPDRPTLPSES